MLEFSREIGGHEGGEFNKRRSLQRAKDLVTTHWIAARDNNDQLREDLLSLGGYSTQEQFLNQVAPKVAVIYVAGGSATRWTKSFSDPIGAEIANEVWKDNTLTLDLRSSAEKDGELNVFVPEEYARGISNVEHSTTGRIISVPLHLKNTKQLILPFV